MLTFRLIGAAARSTSSPLSSIRPSVGLLEAPDHPQRGGLAAAARAEEAEELAVADLEVDVVNGEKGVVGLAALGIGLAGLGVAATEALRELNQPDCDVCHPGGVSCTPDLGRSLAGPRAALRSARTRCRPVAARIGTLSEGCQTTESLVRLRALASRFVANAPSWCESRAVVASSRGSVAPWLRGSAAPWLAAPRFLADSVASRSLSGDSYANCCIAPPGGSGFGRDRHAGRWRRSFEARGDPRRTMSQSGRNQLVRRACFHRSTSPMRTQSPPRPSRRNAAAGAHPAATARRRGPAGAHLAATSSPTRHGRGP